MNFNPDFNGWTIRYSGDSAALYNSDGHLLTQGDYEDIEEYLTHIETRLPKPNHTTKDSQ